MLARKVERKFAQKLLWCGPCYLCLWEWWPELKRDAVKKSYGADKVRVLFVVQQHGSTFSVNMVRSCRIWGRVVGLEECESASAEVVLKSSVLWPWHNYEVGIEGFLSWK